MKWEILSGQLNYKGREMLYHAQCKYCRTVRILSKAELKDDCGCKKRG